MDSKRSSSWSWKLGRKPWTLYATEGRRHTTCDADSVTKAAKEQTEHEESSEDTYVTAQILSVKFPKEIHSSLREGFVNLLRKL